MRIVLMGPPGAGKGTVAGILAAQTGAESISTGDLLRAAVSAGTPLGGEAAGYMDRGELVPDALLRDLVAHRLQACGEGGVILDGYPRTIPQAVSLDFILAERGVTLDLVAELAVPTPVILERLSGRRTCTNPRCQAIHNLQSDPPEPGGLCRKCGAPVAQRPDETEEAIASRLKIYREKSANLAGHYQRKGLLLTVREADSRAAAALILGAVAARARVVVQ